MVATTAFVINFMRLSLNMPNVQSEPRSYMARIVLLGAQSVKCQPQAFSMVMRNSYLSSESEVSNVKAHGRCAGLSRSIPLEFLVCPSHSLAFLMSGCSCRNPQSDNPIFPLCCNSLPSLNSHHIEVCRPFGHTA